MRAIVQREYGSPERLEVAEIDRPQIDADEVLLRVHAASLHPDVWHTVRGVPYVLRLMGAGLRRPRDPVPGTDAAGRVEAVGADVRRFEVGDAVFGETHGARQWTNGGAFAEYVAIPAEVLAPIPEGLTFVEAASVPTSGLIAYESVVERAGVGDGQAVLVNGAGGGVGTIAVQLATAAGATVTAVDSGDKLDLLRSIGADRVVDYRETDVTREAETYDAVLDIPGNHSFPRWQRVLAGNGRYLLIGHDGYDLDNRWLGSFPTVLALLLRSLYFPQLAGMRQFSMPPKGESTRTLANHLRAGRIEPVVDRTYPLADIVPAMAYLTSGAVRGKVVLTVDDAVE